MAGKALGLALVGFIGWGIISNGSAPNSPEAPPPIEAAPAASIPTATPEVAVVTGSAFREAIMKAYDTARAYWAARGGDEGPDIIIVQGNNAAGVCVDGAGESATMTGQNTQEAYYCAGSDNIFVSESWLEGKVEELIGRHNQRIGAPAVFFIVNHEYGHSEQKDAYGKQIFRARPNDQTRVIEDQADCLAGASSQGQPVAVIEGEIDTASKLGSTDPNPSHGTPGERIKAFNDGLNGANCWKEYIVTP
jgi:hypothetical protein